MLDPECEHCLRKGSGEFFLFNCDQPSLPESKATGVSHRANP